MSTIITTFKPFDRFIYRGTDTPRPAIWHCAEFSDTGHGMVRTTGGLALDPKDFEFRPYEGNEALVGTTNDPVVPSGLLTDLFVFSNMPNFLTGGMVNIGYIKDITKDKFLVNDSSYNYALAVKYLLGCEDPMQQALVVKNRKICKLNP